MRIRRILSINLFVESFDHVSKLYMDDLTLPYGVTRPGVNSLYIGDTTLSLITATETDKALIGGNTGVTLRTRGEGDLRRMITRLRERGHALSDEHFRPLRDGHVLMLKDASGNRFALWEDMTWDNDQHYFEGPSSIAIKVRDIRRALAFYHGVLELPMFDQPEPNTALFFPNATNLIVTTGDQWAPCPPKSGETGVCLYAEELPSIIGGLQHRGVRMLGQPQHTDDIVVATILDPDGNHLTLLGPDF